MLFRFPKDDKNFHWTQHIKDKMLFYRIGEQKIRTILKNPDRREEGIALNTSAVMKRNDTPKRKEEIWVMYQRAGGARSRLDVGNVRNDKISTEENLNKRSNRSSNIPHRTDQAARRLILISAWRYPGKSKPGKEIPIPDDILEKIKQELKFL